MKGRMTFPYRTQTLLAQMDPVDMYLSALGKGSFKAVYSTQQSPSFPLKHVQHTHPRSPPTKTLLTFLLPKALSFHLPLPINLVVSLLLETGTFPLRSSLYSHPGRHLLLVYPLLLSRHPLPRHCPPPFIFPALNVKRCQRPVPFPKIPMMAPCA